MVPREAADPVVRANPHLRTEALTISPRRAPSGRNEAPANREADQANPVNRGADPMSPEAVRKEVKGHQEETLIEDRGLPSEVAGRRDKD